MFWDREIVCGFRRRKDGRGIAVARLDVKAVVGLASGDGVTLRLPLEETGETCITVVLFGPGVSDSEMAAMAGDVAERLTEMAARGAEAPPLRRLNQKGEEQK